MGQDDEQNDGEQSLWERYTADIDKLGPANISRDDPKGAGNIDARDPGAAEHRRGKAVYTEMLEEYGHALKPLQMNRTNRRAPVQIDKRTAMRLKRGQMPIDARIDLHGLYQRDAKARLLEFIATSYGRGDRCVLVITGKGQLVFEGETPEHNTPGVIKRNFKSWLNDEPYAAMILKIEKAQIKDGGDGAYYILLRRGR